MRRLVWLLLAFCGLPSAVDAQSVQSTVVELSCTGHVAPPRIEFTWAPLPSASGYVIYRRLPGSSVWTNLATAPAAAVSWTDTTVTVGQAYEYRFDKTGSPAGRGYATSGIAMPAVHSRGTLILIVADNHAAYLSAELTRLERDLIGDGWRVIRHDVSPATTVADVKALIVADYQADPANVASVFLLGDVPVPYSGAVAWDGHPDHSGAWPSDGYYGEMNDIWTDISINSTSASRLENRNVPGDGKFDQSTFPGNVELMVGRVDLAGMPSFPATERELLRMYLDKDHDFRHKRIAAEERAVIDDNFGYFGSEAFAASGWRSFAPMFGAGNSVAADYFTALNTASGPGYLWSYGCGGGSYTSAGGIGSTSDFVTSTNRGIFTMLFGSYHGDWDIADNFMRASLCSGWTLTCAWAGRPAWTFSSMALGEPIGFATRWSQNDPSPSNSSYGARGSHMALMGDPSLRMHVVAPVSQVVGAAVGVTLELSWTASPDPVSGYHVYRLDPATGSYMLLNPIATVEPVYVDAAPRAGANDYMVRALSMQTSSSGSYANLSQGVFGSFPSLVDVAAAGLTEPVQLRMIGANPGLGSSRLAFRIPAAGHVRLAVFDMSGRRVRTLEDGVLAAGTHRRAWDGRNESNVAVAPGMYFVRLAAAGHARSIKVALAR